MTTPTPTSGRLGRIVLVVSLALNLLLAGLIGGAVVSGRGGPQPGIQADLGRMAEFLPRQDRMTIGREIRRDLRAAGVSRRDLARSIDDIAAVLEADPFDADAFAAIIRAQQGWQDQVRVIALDAVIRHLASLPVEERRAVAENLRNRPRQKPGGGGN